MASGKLGNFDNFNNLGEDFIGRKKELAEIQTYFSAKSNSTPRVLIIHAIAGQGKTQLALEYCRQFQAIYGGIFWLNASSDMTVIGSFEKIATELQLVSSECLLDASVKIRAVKEHLQSWKERWLMIFDNYDWPGDYPDTKRLIPSRGRGDVIFTSRNKWLFGLARFLEIPPMESDDGVRLLLRGRGKQDIEQHNVGWSKVVRRLGGLALALSQARAYLRYKNISIEASKNFLITYEAHRNAVLQNMPRDFWESKRTQASGLEAQNMVISAFTTWEMLFQEVDFADQQKKNYVNHFLTLSAFFEPTHIGESIYQCRHQPVYTPVIEWMNIFSTTPEHIASQDQRSSDTNALEVENSESTMSDNGVAKGKTSQCDQESQDHREWDHAKFWDLIWQLQNELSLLHTTSNTDPMSSGFSLHPLIRDWIQVREPAEKIQMYTYEAIDFVHASVQACMDAPIPAEGQRLVLTHLDACIWNDNQFTHKEYRLGRHEFNFYTASSFSTFYKLSGRTSASLELSSAVMETRKQVLGKEHRHTLIAIEQVAGLYIQQVRWKEAEELQQGVIAVKEKIYGSEHLETLASRVKLADIYINQRRQKEAEILLLQVLEKRKKILVQEQVNTTLAMTKLVLVHMGQHKWRDATERCSSVIETQTKVLGAGHPNTLASMKTLAQLYVFQGKRKEAEDLEAQVRQTWNQTRSVAHADTLESVMKSPSSFEGIGQEEAEELFEQERDATKRIPGAQLSDTERIRQKLLANQRGFMNEAKELFAQELVLKDSVEDDEQSEPLKTISMGTRIAYSALNRDKREIRLLTLCSGSFEDEIHCKLGIVSLDETPTYTALSYCWGNQSEQCEVFVDEKKVAVTKSLEIALRYAREDNQDLALWVDAICINQENLEEKSYQVGMMGSIYTAATHVRTWLGESDDDSDVAMDFISQIHTVNFEDPNYQLDPEIWKAVKHLLTRQWWTRAWVIQECFLAKKPTFYCGRKAADRESFTLLLQLKTKYREGLLGYGARLRAMESSLAGPLTFLLEDWDDYKSLSAKGALGLTRMIVATTDNQCSEPVDKIFALLSMCKDLDRQAIKVDYTLSARQLSILVAKYQLLERETRSPLFILQTNQADKDPAFPSWVPDYTQCNDGENHIISFPAGNNLPFTAAANNLAWTSLSLPRLSPQMDDSLNSITLRIEDEGSFETLVLHGLILDVITAAFRTPWLKLYEGSDLAEDTRIKRQRRELIINACKEWEAYVKNLPLDRDPYEKTCTRYHAFWRTLIFDRDLNLLGPPPPDSDLVARFEAWMGRGSENGKHGGEYEEYIRPFNNPAVSRCMYRSFFVTENGYLGLGSRNTVAFQDYVCILRGGMVPFILRKRGDGYWEFVGEAYVHGIMDGEFVKRAKKEDLRVFRIR